MFVAPLAAIATLPYSIPAAIAIVFVSHMLVLYPTLRPTSQWLGPVVTSFETNANEIWLTFDDGPDPTDTPRILDLLDSAEAKATFFVKGVSARRHPQLIREIVQRGHTVGNHSDTHPSAWFWALPPRRVAREVDGCNATLGSLGVKTSLFRAPVGMKNPFVHPILRRRSQALVAWTARGFDGVSSGTPDEVASRIFRDLRPGAIVVLHEGVAAEDGTRFNIACTERVLAGIRERGYRCVLPPVDQLACGRSKTSR